MVELLRRKGASACSLALIAILSMFTAVVDAFAQTPPKKRSSRAATSVTSGNTRSMRGSQTGVSGRGANTRRRRNVGPKKIAELEERYSNLMTEIDESGARIDSKPAAAASTLKSLEKSYEEFADDVRQIEEKVNTANSRPMGY